MNWRNFIKELSIFSIIMLAILFALAFFPLTMPYQNFGWLSWVIFICLSLWMFYIGQKAAVSKNKFAFSNLVIGTMIIKLFLGFTLSVLYYQLAQPTNKYFIIPLSVVYLGYTGFETYFMMKLGKNKSQDQ